MFKAQYGSNTFVVMPDELTASRFPNHVNDTTIYGRLASQDYVVNVDVQLHLDTKVQSTLYYCELASVVIVSGSRPNTPSAPRCNSTIAVLGHCDRSLTRRASVSLVSFEFAACGTLALRICQLSRWVVSVALVVPRCSGLGVQLGGYVGTFDLRDPGQYALHVLVGAFFGSTDPQFTPVPIVVGAHTSGYVCFAMHSQLPYYHSCSRTQSTL